MQGRTQMAGLEEDVPLDGGRSPGVFCQEKTRSFLFGGKTGVLLFLFCQEKPSLSFFGGKDYIIVYAKLMVLIYVL